MALKTKIKKSAASLCLQGIQVIRDGKIVLSQIDWTVYSGEHWVVMGNNGSGKSTLLEVLMGYLWPSKGKVQILGETYGKTFLPAIRKRIGFIAPWVLKMIPDHLRVSNVVASGLEGGTQYFGPSTFRVVNQVRSAMRFFGILDFYNKPFAYLSSGEQLKVCFARAWISKPKILILDEPFSLLDMGSRYQIYHLMDKLSRTREAPTVLMTTHHLQDIRNFFTHALLLRDGKVEARGVVKKVLMPKIFNHVFGTRLKSISLEKKSEFF